MNCIFCCVFSQEKYVDMLYLFLESLFIYGNLTNDTEVLIYTTTEFMSKIKNSSLYDPEKIIFEINNNYTDISKACTSRLDLFELNSAKKYEKILYLDIDIIIKNDINRVFEVCTNDVLYVLKEGNIDDHSEYWGKSLFGDEANNYEDKTAFTSGILLFNNNDNMKHLFQTVKEDIITRNILFTFYDQPFIVYNAFKYVSVDKTSLIKLAVNKLTDFYGIISDNNTDDCFLSSDKVIYHFPGGPGNWNDKLTTIRHHLNELKDRTITHNINKTKEYISEHLMPIVINSGEKLEGNIFTLHHSNDYTDTFLNKAKNISNLVLNRNKKNVAEIGFNAGFSALLMLISNPELHVTCYDIGCHKYTMPCFLKLTETFGNRVKLIIGDSVKTLKKVNDRYQIIHIDGGHSTEIATSDILNSYRLSSNGTVLIMDDYDFPNLHELWNHYINSLCLRPIEIHLYETNQHDIKVV